MSTNLDTLKTSANPDVHVTAFHGGRYRGRMVQLDQGPVNEIEAVYLDRAQAEQLVKQLNNWLENGVDEHAPSMLGGPNDHF